MGRWACRRQYCIGWSEAEKMRPGERLEVRDLAKQIPGGKRVRAVTLSAWTLVEIAKDVKISRFMKGSWLQN